MINWGTVPLGAVLPFPFATYGKTNGESITLTGLAVTDVEVFKGTSMTQRASDAGYTLMDTDGIDIDTITGIHGFSIDTGDNTDAGFFVAGSFYWVVVSAVTVDSQTVNFIAGTFSLRAAESVAGVMEVDVTHWLGTAAATPTVAGVPEVDVTHFGGTAGTFVSGIPAVNATQIEGVDATNQIRDSVVDDATRIDASALNSLSGSTVAADAASAAADASAAATQASGANTKAADIQSRLPAALVSGRMDSSVGAVAAAASNYKKNAASAGFLFAMTDSTNHAPATGLTVTATRSIDGAAFGACANAVSEVSNGVYAIDLAAADVNGNHIMLRFTATGADDRLIEIITQP